MRLIIFLLSFSIIIACKQEPKKAKNPVAKRIEKSNHPEIAINMLRDFYLNFYTADEPLDKNKTIDNYVSQRVLKRIDSLRNDPENLILDYDPFIKGQDYNGEAIKNSLKIEPLKTDSNYRVSFLQFGEPDEKRTNVDVFVKKNDKGKFLIYSIINDEHLNFKY